MNRYICIHGHFYQPPRENPWLEAIELQHETYPYHDWTRPLYFVILIPHIILAALMTPFIFYIVYQAWRGEFSKHRRVARLVWPVWMFVSVTGVIVYLMLYQL